MTIVWDVHWIGSMSMIRRLCLRDWPCRRADVSGSRHNRCISIRPRFPSTASILRKGEATKRATKKRKRFPSRSPTAIPVITEPNAPQWMLGLVTTHDGDLPIFMRPLDGNSSDKERISAMVTAVMTQLRETLEEEQEERLAVFDSGGYSEANRKRYNEAKIKWISRVPETSTEAKTAVEEEPTEWQALSDGSGQYRTCIRDLPQGKERWVIVRTKAGEQAARVQMEKKVKKAKAQWEKQLWHLSKQEFACQSDAETALKQAMKGKPAFLTVSSTSQEEGHYQHKGRPKKDGAPDSTAWHVMSTLTVDQSEMEAQIKKQARFIVATNVLDEQRLSHEQVYLTYKEQGGVERGVRFLKDPLFLASSVFVKKPERVMALSFIMVLCLLVYRLAEHRLRARLAQTQQTIPDQVHKPTARPTMRWVFQC